MTDAYTTDRRQVAPALSGGFPWWVLPGMGGLVEGVFLVALVMAYLGEDKTLLNVMCTAAIAQAGIATSYFFGSSAGSKSKDDAMAVSAIKKDETIAASSAALAVSVPVPAPAGHRP